GIMSPIQGFLLDRFGPRKVAATGVILGGCGFMLFSQLNSILTFYAAFFVVAIGWSLAGHNTVSFTVVQWFVRRRATAISLSMGGLGIGGMAIPIIAYCIETFGWRSTAFG